MLAWKDLMWEWFIRLLNRTIGARKWTIEDWVKIAVNLDLYTLQKYCSRIGQSIYRKQTKLRTFTTKRTIKKKKIQGLLWWLSGKESTCQCRRHRFDPWSGKIPNVAEQLSLCTTNTEPMLPRTCALQQEEPRQWEAHAPQLRSSPRSPQLDKSPHAVPKTQRS